MPTPALPVAVQLPGVARYAPGATFGPRAMREWEFVWLIEGDAVYHCDGADHPAPQGSIVLCRPGTTDAFTWDTSRHTVHGYFHFQCHFDLTDWPPVSDWPVVRQPPEQDVLRPLFAHVLQVGSASDAPTCAASVMALLHAFVSGHMSTFAPPAAELPEPVDRAMRHLHELLDRRPQEPPTLDELAEAACVTREHLSRLFTRHIGHSPMRAALLARLDRSLSLVVRSNYSVKQIAAMLGFATPFHFSRCFRQAFGASPRAVRESSLKGKVPPLPKLLKVRFPGA